RRYLSESHESGRESLAAHDCKAGHRVVARVRRSDATQVGDPAVAGVAAHQGLEPSILPQLVAVEVCPFLTCPPPTARTDTHEYVGWNAHDAECVGIEPHARHDLVAVAPERQLDVVARDRSSQLESQGTHEARRGLVALGM